MKQNTLTSDEKRVIVDKGTEAPFTGKYYNHKEAGVYTCKRCDAPLFKSTDKFDSGCGWPSFDDAIKGAVSQVPDADGRRTEIVCNFCRAHLGHVFVGEGLTEKNTRHCVNSISMNFTSETAQLESAKAYFAGGCFWGTEHLLQSAEGVLGVRSGYMGGRIDNPSYRDICSGSTGHAETVEVLFDPSKIDFESLAKLFFEIHDPTQVNRQGPDVGDQYRSAVFYVDDHQREITEKLIGLLKANGYAVVTEVVQADKFWAAEDYHQDYYERSGKEPYCHVYQKRF
ncbi:MAG: bifunctional methionine sulfoxide reductase B/A protein [candidate division Zixibacteria bacterium]|nr:bifunctional methionine sulfoxide reductase B/A protein [candidate division Zixibacteria bacterium]MDH4033425.1 bifunctional methionine sulfoxide reductase B/A protein [candidate division Zixibacteria bacterium]